MIALISHEGDAKLVDPRSEPSDPCIFASDHPYRTRTSWADLLCIFARSFGSWMLRNRGKNS